VKLRLGSTDGAPEASGVHTGLRADRPDDRRIADAPVEGAPRAPPGAGSKLPELGHPLDPTAVREGELVAVDLELLERMVHRGALGREEHSQVPLSLRANLDVQRAIITRAI
jgi:hypothetical protein